MSTAVREILESFEQLPESEQREFVAIILRRAVEMEMLPPSDEEFVWMAEELFLALDHAEEQHERAAASSASYNRVF
ncbi:MAG: hypothetical protein HY741_25980 [Chloroflexi bacterium]|nr:hypothetical protein [Chloroflexota bacterium]